MSLCYQKHDCQNHRIFFRSSILILITCNPFFMTWNESNVLFHLSTSSMNQISSLVIPEKESSTMFSSKMMVFEPSISCVCTSESWLVCLSCLLVVSYDKLNGKVCFREAHTKLGDISSDRHSSIKWVTVSERTSAGK